MTLRCTVKLLKLIGLNPRDLENLSSEERRFEWHVNLLWLDRRKCLLFTNSLTLFSFLVPDVLKYDLNPIGRLFINHLTTELESEHLPINTFGPLELSKIFLATTSDRSVLGCMNDLAKACDFAVRSAGDLWELDVSDLNCQLRRTPLSPLSYSYPIDRTQELVRDSSL
jgi:hypothetical protein